MTLSINSAKHLHLFSSCIPVKGASRCIIIDIQTFEIDIVPNSLYFIITNEIDRYSIRELRRKYRKQEKVLIEYLKYLLNKNICFVSEKDKKISFPKLRKNWSLPSRIANAIISHSTYSPFDLNTVLIKFDILGCCHLELRFLTGINFNKILNVLQFIETKTSFRSVVLYFDSSYKGSKIIKSKLLKFRKLLLIVGYNGDKNSTIHNVKPIMKTTVNLFSNNCCGMVNTDNFSINLEHYFESQKFNTCLNGKMSIDTEGNIKNCPSMKESYGNIKDTTLSEALKKRGFKKYWKINKDKIKICQDCEFRYVCTDCRAYTEDPNDKYSKPLKCGYDPYTAKWEEWSTNPLKQKAIEHYGMQELVKSPSKYKKPKAAATN